MSELRPMGKSWMLVLALDSILRCGLCFAQTDHAVSRRTVDGGGGDSAGSRFAVTGTLGQPDAGFTSNGRFSIQAGFWGPVRYSSAPTPTSTPSLESTMTPTPTRTPSLESTMTPTPTRTPSLEPTTAPTPTPTEDSADCDSGYYVLDSLGGRHAVGSPPVITGPVFFGWDIARDMERVSCNVEGATVEDLVLLDGLGATHFVMNSSCNVLQDFYFIDQVDQFPQGRAVDMEISADGKGLWVLTDYGGIYRGGSTKADSEASLIPGTLLGSVFGFDMPIDPLLRPSSFPNPGGACLRAVSLVVIDSDSDNQPEGFLILDSLGGRRHLKPDGTDYAAGAFPGAEPNSPNLLLDPTGYVWPFFTGLDIARDMELHSSQAGVVILDGWGGIHPVPVSVETSPVYFATNRISNLSDTPRYTVGMPYVTTGFDDPTTEVEEDDSAVFGSDAASIFKDLEFSSCDGGFYVLDRFGGVFAFGAARGDDSSVMPSFEGAPYFFPLLLAEDMEVFVKR